MAIDTSHLPWPPGWDCRECQRPWPCRRRREELLIEYATHPTTVAVVQTGHLLAALDDLAELEPHLAYRRFVGWLPGRATALNRDDPDHPRSTGVPGGGETTSIAGGQLSVAPCET